MKKVLAIILSLALVFSTTVCGFTAFAAEETDTATSEYYWDPVDKIGYEESMIDIRGGSLSDEAIEAAKPRLVSGGVDGSNAIEVGGTDAYTRYLMHFRINGLELNKNYVIKMDVKRVSGAIRTLQAGVWRVGTLNFSETTYANADISSDDFTTLTFESALTTGTYIPYYLILNFNATSAGATLLIDNIVVYEKDDTTMTNIFNSGLQADTGSLNPGSFDKGYKLWFDDTVDPNARYFPITSIPYRTSGTANVVPALSNMGEGINGSYAMKLETAASKQTTLYFQPSSTSIFSTSTEYIIEMKIKKSAGAISSNNLLIGMNEGSWNWSKTITDAELSDEYTYFKWSHTTNATSGWKYLSFRYTATADGATLLVDDIKVYLASDTTKTPISFQNGLEADCDFDVQKYYATPVVDNSEIGMVYSPAATVGDKTSGSSGVSSYDAAIAPEIVTGGVNSTNAMQIGGSTEAAISNYLVSFAATGYNPSTSYRIEFDVKKVSGTVTSLKIANTTCDNSLTLDDSRIPSSFTTIGFDVVARSTININTYIYLQFTLNTPEGGAVLLIDNIRVTSANVTAPAFTSTTTNTFTFDSGSGQLTPVYNETAPEDELASFNPSSNKASAIDGVETTNVAEIVNLANADTGSYAMAIGAANDDPTNATVRFGLKEMYPSKTYKVKFSAYIVGSFNRFVASVTPSNGITDVYEVSLSKNSPEADVPRVWTEYEFTYTDPSTIDNYHAYSYLLFKFEDIAGAASLFVDSVSVIEIDENGNEVGPNIFADGNFEYPVTEEADWSNSPYWSGDSATDFSFMQNIEKTIGGYGTGITEGIDFLDMMLTDSTYSSFNEYFISSNKYSVVEFEAEKLASADKNVWLSVVPLITDYKSLVDDWQTVLIRYATLVQGICGDNFQGFYFDEPAYYFTDEEFINVTKYCREHFRKRVFAIHFSYAITADSIDESVKMLATADNHAYVTDAGYWRYGTWDTNGDVTLAAWQELAAQLNANTRKWIVPILGRNDYLQTESDVKEIIENLMNRLREIDGFGGVVFYAMAYQPEKIDIDNDPETTADDMLAQAIADGTVKTEIFTIKDTNGSDLFYRYHRGGGAYVINPNSEEYWPEVAALVNKIVAEFEIDNTFKFTEKCGDFDIVNGAILVPEGTTVSELITSSGLADIATTNIISTESLAQDALLGTDYTLSSEFITDVFTYQIAVENDLNGDAVVDITDLVRIKKLSLKVIEGSAAQYVAAGAIEGEINATNITALKRLIFSKI